MLNSLFGTVVDFIRTNFVPAQAPEQAPPVSFANTVNALAQTAVSLGTTFEQAKVAALAYAGNEQIIRSANQVADLLGVSADDAQALFDAAKDDLGCTLVFMQAAQQLMVFNAIKDTLSPDQKMAAVSAIALPVLNAVNQVADTIEQGPRIKASIEAVIEAVKAEQNVINSLLNAFTLTSNLMIASFSERAVDPNNAAQATQAIETAIADVANLVERGARNAILARNNVPALPVVNQADDVDQPQPQAIVFNPQGQGQGQRQRPQRQQRRGAPDVATRQDAKRKKR
ncbi:MAG: hypothetical protein AB7V32_00985 [Candidatus Berkiella sp.]